MHVELNDTRKRNEEKRGKVLKPFIYKEIDFPVISKERGRKHSGKFSRSNRRSVHSVSNYRHIILLKIMLGCYINLDKNGLS